MDEQKVISRIEALERKVNNEPKLNRDTILGCIATEVRRLQKANDDINNPQEIRENAKCISHLAFVFVKVAETF